MAISLNDNIQNNSPKALDNKYLKNGTTPYAGTADVFATVPIAYRSKGLTVLVDTGGGVLKEYWFKNGTADLDLTEKQLAASWGTISGVLASQTDLQSALDSKEPTLATGSSSQYFRGDKTLATFPVFRSSVTSAVDTTFSVPAGKLVTHIVINPTLAITALNIGTTNGGGEILPTGAGDILASSDSVITVNKYFRASGTIFFSGVTSLTEFVIFYQ